MGEPVAYFITFTTYGTWLHGRAPGSVDRRHNVPGTPFLPPDAETESRERAKLVHSAYALDETRRTIVLHALRDVAAYRRWRLWAAHVRTNHVHLVATAVDTPPEKVMRDCKALASRRLREVLCEPSDLKRWTQHGSTRWLNAADSFLRAIQYVLDEQGDRLAWYDGRMSGQA